MVTRKNKKEFKMVDKGLSFIALKNHVIKQNDTVLTFKKGERYTGISSKWENALRQEKIIKEET